MPSPAYVVQHTYLGEGPARMHHRRPVLMMASRIEDNPREADCSGRALATLVIAWVGAALVASVLLKWTHMWVALAVLTLLFLVACGYAACDARRTQERAFAREANRQLERRRRREQQIESVSVGIDNFPEIIDPPDYQTYWVADLPPSYTTAVGTQTGNVTSSATVPDPELEAPSPIPAPRLSNPPPYAVAVQAEPLFLPIVQNSGQNMENNTSQQLPAGQVQNNMILQTSAENEQTSSHTVRIAPAMRDQDKVEEGDVQNATTTTTAPAAPSRTQYLTSILNSTFGRNTRRGNNPEQNIAVQTNSTSDRAQGNETMNNRAREENLGVNHSNNNERNSNISNGSGPPPPYPAVQISAD